MNQLIIDLNTLKQRMAALNCWYMVQVIEELIKREFERERK